MWKQIRNFDYEISDIGVVRRKSNHSIITGSVNSYGYRVIRLRYMGKNYDFKLHRLLADYFIPKPSNYDCVNHIDGDKLNNSLDNLEWCTRAYNNQHAREQLSLDFSEKPIEQRTLNGDLVAIWTNANLAATLLGFSATTIGCCCRGTQKQAYDFLWSYRL